MARGDLALLGLQSPREYLLVDLESYFNSTFSDYSEVTYINTAKVKDKHYALPAYSCRR